MDITCTTFKIEKGSVGRKIDNDYGLDIRLYHPKHLKIVTEYVGAIIVVKELKNHFRGHLVRATHEEFKNNCFAKINWEFKKLTPEFPKEVKKMLEQS